MRGKNILWLALIAIFFNAMLVTVATGQLNCKIYVDPLEIHNEDMLTTTFSIDINVQNAEDLYSYAFKVNYAPYVSLLAVSTVTEGDFLKEEGISTDFVYKIDPFHGWVAIGNARLGQVPGASGDGTLATIVFTVLEAGESPLDLDKVEMYDSAKQLIACEVVSGYYYGPAVEFRDISFDPGRSVNLKTFDTVTIKTTMQNTGEVPLDVKVRYDILGEGLWNTFYCGQSFVTTVREPVYLYVNEYSEFWDWDWDKYGASPWLDAADYPDNYIESSIYDASLGTFGFEDLTLEPGDVIGRVVLEGYTQYPGGSDEDMDMDMLALLWDPFHFAWAGSLYGSADWGWHTPRWIGADLSQVFPELLGSDATNLNNLLAFATYWTADGLSHGPMRLDALRLRVEFAQYNPLYPEIYTLQPGETLEVEGSWMLTGDDKGRYLCRATIEFTYNDYSWIPGIKIKDFNLNIFDSTKIK